MTPRYLAYIIYHWARVERSDSKFIVCEMSADSRQAALGDPGSEESSRLKIGKYDCKGTWNWIYPGRPFETRGLRYCLAFILQLEKPHKTDRRRMKWKLCFRRTRCEAQRARRGEEDTLGKLSRRAAPHRWPLTGLGNRGTGWGERGTKSL